MLTPIPKYARQNCPLQVSLPYVPQRPFLKDPEEGVRPAKPQKGAYAIEALESYYVPKELSINTELDFEELPSKNEEEIVYLPPYIQVTPSVRKRESTLSIPPVVKSAPKLHEEGKPKKLPRVKRAEMEESSKVGDREGIRVESNENEVIWKFADIGVEEEMMHVGCCYLNGIEIKRKGEYEWYVKGAKGWNAGGNFDPGGSYYQSGIVARKDEEKALEWDPKPPENENPWVKEDLGFYCEDRIGAEISKQKKSYYYRMSTDNAKRRTICEEVVLKSFRYLTTC
ncbi:2595_t:CDS:2 [Gigaspora rosea]|nr:2595_t:CDS:2 [Gigaspora rosea]